MKSALCSNKRLQPAPQELLEGLGAAQELWCVTRAYEQAIYFAQVSNSFAELLGYPDEILLSRPWKEFVYEKDLEMVRGVSEGVRRESSPFMKSRVRYKRSSGKLVCLEFHSIRRGDFVYSVCRDVTEMIQVSAVMKAAKATLKELSMKDGLTGLFNRRTYDEFFVREIRRAARTMSPLSLLSLDLDHFKKVNDNFGHEIGDRTLMMVANVIRKAVRVEDYVFRLGGEELAVLLPDCPIDGALKVAWYIVHSVRECEVAPNLKVTISVGAVTFPDHGTEIPTLSRAADEALYAAKSQGRNRVISRPG